MTPNRPCPVCLTDSAEARLFLEENIDASKLSGYSFASRKTPEFMCHRLVQCQTCDLVYVDRPPAEADLANAYHVAQYDSSEEADDAAAAYIRAVRSILDRLPQRERALEIGAGTGVFLEYLRLEGFTSLTGVEPSSAAIEAAPAARRAWIRKGTFQEADFAPASFDLICCFMTMEHVGDPRVIASAAFRLLRPGGAFVIIVHDYRSVVNRMLGRRSPIIDIEHMQLFSKKSVGFLYQRTGYEGITAEAFRNTYALRYWIRLLPLPHAIKLAVLKTLSGLHADGMKLGMNVGNLIAAGFKPN